MTPFQRQAIMAARKVEHEEQERRQEDLTQQGGGGRPRNSRAGNAGSSNTVGNRSEKVRYVNRELNPDHSAHDD